MDYITLMQTCMLTLCVFLILITYKDKGNFYIKRMCLCLSKIAFLVKK